MADDEKSPPPKEAKEDRKEEKEEKDEDDSTMEKALTSVLEPLVGAFEKMSARMTAMEARLQKSEFPLAHVNANAGAAEQAKAGDESKVDVIPGQDSAVKPGANTEDTAGTFAQKAGAGISKADLESILKTHADNIIVKAVETVKASTPAPVTYADQVKSIRKSWMTGIEGMIVGALEEDRKNSGFDHGDPTGVTSHGGWKAASTEAGIKTELYVRKMLGDE